MSAARRIRRALGRTRRVPLRLVPAEAAYRARRAAVVAGRRLRDAFRSTYGGAASRPAVRRGLAPGLDPRQVADEAPDLPDRCARYLEHRFDLLGSGWRRVVHRAHCPGFEGHRYEAPPVTPDPEGSWLAGQVSRPNLAAARAVWRLLGPGYRPIDWHLDFRSGYRWSPLTWYRAVPHGHLPGVDVKVPWELARMQHLPQLALAFGCARAGLPRFGSAERYRDAFRDQVLDFVATNPPRHGVNWHTTMEVAIRMANWLLAYDLFGAYGAAWDPEFERVFARSVMAHGRHIAGNPERSPAWRNNHYLANLVGLAFAGAYLGSSPEPRRWLRTADAALATEIEHQFLPDGGHFEASTGYHAFAAELAAYGLAITGAGRRRAGHAEPDGGLPESLREALARTTAFLMDLTKPDGSLVQIGDHDGGRLFKLTPRRRPATQPGRDRGTQEHGHPDARPVVAAANGLLGRRDFARWCGGRRLEESLVAGLSGAAPPECTQENPASPGTARTSAGSAPRLPALCERLRETPAVESSRLTLAAPGGSLLTGATVRAYPDFGAYVFRSDRLFLVLRAGFARRDGTGGHAHVDQLALEVAIDGVSWIRDPGSYVYTASPRLRNAYRSSAAHFTPYELEDEAVLWRRGLFHLDLDVRILDAAAGPRGFAVDLLLEGNRIAHTVTVGNQEVAVATRFLERARASRVRLRSRRGYAGRRTFAGTALAGALPFASGYGRREPGKERLR